MSHSKKLIISKALHDANCKPSLALQDDQQQKFLTKMSKSLSGEKRDPQNRFSMPR
jgi:hypothetical protein